MRHERRRVLLMAISLILAACGPAGRGAPVPAEDEMAQRTIEEVQEAHTAEWMALPGVVGIGIGACEGEPCIRILLARPSPEAEARIPERVEGHRVELEVTGQIRSGGLPRPPPAGGV